MNDPIYRSVHINDWHTFKSLLSKLPGKWIFRGQADASWDLATTLERSFVSSYPLRPIEEELIERFQQRAHHFLNGAQLPCDTLQWLALMQHHGAPTRLHDWTMSPYVGAYFALEEARGQSAVWAINYSWLREKARICLSEHLVPSPPRGSITADCYAEPDFVDLLLNDKEKLVIPLFPKKLTIRQTIQQGLFLFPLHTACSFIDNLSAYLNHGLSDNLIRVVLDQKIRLDALYDLNLMNITRASLFPGLDGFARSLTIETLLKALSIHD